MTLGESNGVDESAEAAMSLRMTRLLQTLIVGLALSLLVVCGLLIRSKSAPRFSLWSVRLAMANRDWAGAERLLRQRLESVPDDSEALLALGGVLASTHQAAEADLVLQRVREADPLRSQAISLRGELAIDRHEAAEAERLLTEAAGKDPQAVVPRRRLIYLYSLQGRTGEARDRFWEIYRISQDRTTLIDLSLAAWSAENDTRGLVEQALPFLKQTPEDPRLQRIVGLGLLKLGKAAEARPLLESAARSLENDPVGRFALAECRSLLGEPSNGLDQLGPEPSEPIERSLRRTLLARLEEASGRDDEALRSLKSAVVDNPNNREAHFRLGRLLRRRGDELGAKQSLDRAESIRRTEGLARRELERVRQAGFDRDAFERLAKLCKDAGLIAEARAWLEQAVRVDPSRQSSQSALAELSKTPDRYLYPLARFKRIDTENVKPFAAETVLPPESTGLIHFEDAADRVGLRFAYDSGANGDLFIGDTMGGGVALIDYDHDGRLDVYFINGCKLPYDPKTPPAPNRLFRNKPDGTFEDVTARAGVGGKGYGMGAAVGDYDGDGHADLFVTGLGSTVLYHNKGDGTFEDVTAKAGVVSDRWTTAAGFADLDGDGDLDLVAVTYVDADPRQVFPCLDQAGKPIHCSPGRFNAQVDHLWRNDGEGRFTEVAKSAGLDRPNGRGLGLAIADFDQDGKLDLFVANDASPNFLFRNLGNLTFEEAGESSGVALDGQGQATASMGVVADDLDGDGLIDLFHTNFINESNTFRRNLGKGQFADATLAANLAASRSKTGFGTVALDVDGDGRLDLFVADGHVDDQPWIDAPMAQEPQLYRAVAPGRFRPASTDGFPYLGRKVVGRGVAKGDLNGDGAEDLIVVHRDAPASLLLNRRPPPHWLAVRPLGRNKRIPAIGARVSCRSKGRTTTRFLSAGTSYLSASEDVLRFALEAAEVQELEIRWPSGKVWKQTALPADRVLEVVEPD